MELGNYDYGAAPDSLKEKPIRKALIIKNDVYTAYQEG